MSNVECYYCPETFDPDDTGVTVRRKDEKITMCDKCAESRAFYCGYGHHTMHITDEHPEGDICNDCAGSRGDRWTAARIAQEWPSIWTADAHGMVKIPIVAITNKGESVRLEHNGLITDIPTGRAILALNNDTPEWAVKPAWRHQHLMESDIRNVYIDKFNCPTTSCPHCGTELPHWDTIRTGGFLRVSMHISGQARSDGAIEIIDLESGRGDYDGEWTEEHYCPECERDITSHISDIETAIDEAYKGE